jgi:hypothetical protein
MQGAFSDCDPNTNPHDPGQPAARIRRQLDDIHHQHLPRLAQALARLQADAADWDNTPLAQALVAFHAAGRAMHPASLRQGWLSRLFGSYREACTQFVAAYERMAACEAQVKTHLAQLSAGGMEKHLAAREAFAGFETESAALDAAIDEGVNGLQAMCTQLADERAGGRYDDELTTRAEKAQFFMQDFKRLQSLSSAVQDAVVRARTVLTRRGALLDQAKAELVTFEQAWVHRMSDVVSAIHATRNPAPVLPKAQEVHEELMKRLSASADASAALQHEEHLMAQQLAALQQDLVAPPARGES